VRAGDSLRVSVSPARWMRSAHARDLPACRARRHACGTLLASAGRRSISLLAAFLAARMRGTLDAVEASGLAVEKTHSVAAAAGRAHPAAAVTPNGLVCAQRSICRRLRAVRPALLAVVTLPPELLTLTGTAPTVAALRDALGAPRVPKDRADAAARAISLTWSNCYASTRTASPP
jgi:hypothetical protein